MKSLKLNLIIRKIEVLEAKKDAGTITFEEDALCNRLIGWAEELIG